MTCLLDSGCDENILPKRLAKKFKMNAADEQTVYATNGTSIAILGSIHANIFVGGQKTERKISCCVMRLMSAYLVSSFLNVIVVRGVSMIVKS